MLRFLITGLISTLLLAACKDGQEALQKSLENAVIDGEIDLTGVPPERMLLSPAEPSIAAGERMTMIATGIYSRGHAREIVERIQWTSSLPNVFSVDDSGQGMGLSEGQSVITASYLGVSVSTKIIVGPAAITQILIFPEDIAVKLPLKNGQLLAQDISLKAFALKTDGQLNDLTEEVSWHVDESSGLTENIEKPGQYTAKAVGAWPIRISYAGFETSKAVKITQQKKTLVRIKPSVNPLIMRAGETLPLDAIAVYSDDSESALASWTLSESSDLFTIRGKQITAVKTGSFSTTLKADQMQVSLEIYIQQAEITSISISPPSFTLYHGETALYTVLANYGDGTKADITSGSFIESINSSVVSVNASTTHIEAVAQGSTNLKATYQGQQALALVAVDQPVLSRLEVRPSALRVVAGRTVNYQVYGIYTNGTEADITGLANAQTISTSRAEVLFGNPGELLGKSNGMTILSATYVDPLTTRNLSGSAAVTVDPPELLGLTLSNSTASIALGRAFEFGVQGTYSDRTQIDVGSLIQITADVTSPGMSYVGSITRTTGNQIRVQSVAQGSMRIIAKLAEQTASVILTVTEKQLDSVQIHRLQPFSNGGFLLKGSSTDFTAVATFSDTSTLDVTDSTGIYNVLWSPPNPVIASFTDTGDGKKRLTGETDGDAYFTITVTSIQGNASAAYGIGVYIPCSGSGKYYGYQCWFLGLAGNSCDTTCSIAGRVNHNATTSVAGSGSSGSGECSNILGSLFRSSMNSFNSAATATQGVGCSIFTQSGLNLGLREATLPTTGSATLTNFRRACSCE